MKLFGDKKQGEKNGNKNCDVFMNKNRKESKGEGLKMVIDGIQRI